MYTWRNKAYTDPLLHVFVVWVKYCTYIYISIYIICEHTLDTHIEITSDLFFIPLTCTSGSRGRFFTLQSCQLFAWMPWVCVIVVHPSLDVWNYAEVFVVSRWPLAHTLQTHTHTIDPHIVHTHYNYPIKPQEHYLDMLLGWISLIILPCWRAWAGPCVTFLLWMLNRAINSFNRFSLNLTHFRRVIKDENSCPSCSSQSEPTTCTITFKVWLLQAR